MYYLHPLVQTAVEQFNLSVMVIPMGSYLDVSHVAHIWRGLLLLLEDPMKD